MEPIQNQQVNIQMQQTQNDALADKSLNEIKNHKPYDEKPITVERTDSNSTGKDNIFEDERKFVYKEKQKRNNGDFVVATVIEKLFFIDFIGLLYRSAAKARKLISFPITEVPNLGKNDHSDRDSKILIERLSKEKKPISELSPKTIWNTILSIYRFEYYSAMICCILVILTKLLNGIFINLIIDELSDYLDNKEAGIEESENDKSLQNIYIYLVIVCLSVMIYALAMHQSNRFCYQLTIKIRTQFLSLIYDKISIMSSFQIKNANIGKLVNLASNDFNMIEFKMYPIIQYYCVWVSFVLSIVILVVRFGWTGLISMAVLTIGVFIQQLIATSYGKFAMKRAQYNDQRIKLCNEVIDGIRLIKMYTWEGEFTKIIKVIRTNELYQSFFLFFNYNLCNALNNILGFYAIVIQIAIMVAIGEGEDITAGQIFSTLDLIQFMRFQLMLSSIGMIGQKEFLNIMKRSTNIMAMEAITTTNIESDDSEFQKKEDDFQKSLEADTKVALKNYSAYWKVFPKGTKQIDESINENAPVLKDITFQAKKGELIGIIGKVGAGKSSLLSSFLNEIPTIKGHFYQNGSVAYVEQEPYILNGSVRDNIILGLEFDKEKYQKVVDVCCLLPDFQELQDQDQTEIGEKGINLSGGQKARISLARAVYQDADIYLLDDPLSAVDAKVGKQLFKNVVQGYLKDKCVLLVTHQIHFMQTVDNILIMKESKIVEQGLFIELEEHIKDLAGQMNMAMLQNRKQSSQVVDLEKSVKIVKGVNDKAQVKVFDKSIKKLMLSEDQEIINVQYKTYWGYLTNSKQLPMVLIIICQFLFDLFMYLKINELLADYEESDEDERHDILVNCSILSAIFFVTQVLKYANLCQFHLCSVREYQLKLIASLFRTKTSFFDQTPTGNIINRFANDTGLTDVPLFQYIVDSVEIGLFATGLLAYIGYLNVWLFIGMFIQLLFLVMFYRMCTKLLRLTRVMDIRHKSPVYTFFSATLGGILPLKIYKQIDTFKSIFRSLVDDSQRTSYFFWFLSRGYGFTAQFISSVIGSGIITAIILIVINGGDNESKDIGLIIIYIMVIQDMVQWLLRQIVNLEIAMGSLERINNYTTDVPHEKPYILKGEEKLIKENHEFVKQGTIEFKNVSLRYRAETDLVLKNLSFVVPSGEKVGCVGRTGAGKSSLLQALFRMIEIENEDKPDQTGIYIDGQRIQDYGLKIVRNSMSIIPQIPFVFAGSIKRNLDPLDEFSDQEIIQVLKEIDLIGEVNKLEQGIHTDMSNVSSVFSIGQKQLICLGRTILKKSKIIVLDEATANVDMQTDDFIQKTIKDKFTGSTVFTIAHRLNTIADYDKVLVMDKGKLAQYDAPFKLLTLKDSDQTITNEDSIFAQMVKNTGKQNAQQIFEVAKQTYFSKKKL